jgi:NHLM bacteriocin system ABC transporter peptidase/ATP-binding protein
MKIPRNNYKNTPSILQMEMVECGAAALAMVCAYYGKYIPLEELRVACGVTRDGVNAINIIKSARNIGLEAKGFRKDPHELADLKPPMILHWNFNHFVVFEGFKNGKAYINDPASGHRVLSLDELDMAFTGVALTFEPTDAFVRSGQRGGMWPSLKKRLNTVKSAFAFLLIIGVLMVVPGILTPIFSRIFIDDLLLGGKTQWLTPLLLGMLAALVVQALLTALQQRFLLRMETKLALIGAGNFLWHILRLPVVFFQQRSAGDISSRVGSNDSVAEFLSGQLATNVINAITIVFYLYIMARYNLLLAMISLLLAAVNIAYFIYSSSKVEELNRKMMQDMGKLYGTAISGLSIIETLKATGTEQGFFSKWSGYHAKQLNAEQKTGAFNQIMFALPNFISGFSNILVLCIGGLQILHGRMTIGTLIAFQGLLSNFMSPISGLTQMGLTIKALKGDMARLDDVAKYAVDELADPERDVPPSEAPEESFAKLSGDVEVKDLTFGYNVLEGPLIEDFSLRLKPGSRVALVGPSGSGKSTVAKLITGIYKPWTGEILFDGKKRESLPRHTITNSLASVDQDVSMFEGSIMNNITMWDSTVSEDYILQATKDACIHDDITKRNGGYNSEVAESGTNFSGGQRQRLEIARALSADPTILIMDEATSALDVNTEKIVSDNIKERGCTCIIVAHRLSTIRDCDEIIVMKNGKIVQRGTHDQMKNEVGLYAELIHTAV